MVLVRTFNAGVSFRMSGFAFADAVYFRQISGALTVASDARAVRTAYIGAKVDTAVVLTVPLICIAAMAVLRTFNAGSIFLIAAGAVANPSYIRQFSGAGTNAGRGIAVTAGRTSVCRVIAEIRRLTGTVADAFFSL